jgi:hypothetical protein
MSKPICIVSCPIDTFSGYGARSRDFVKSLIASKGEEWDIRILSQRWGSTPWGYLKQHGEQDLINRIIPYIPKQPDVWFQITVPNEFQSVGKLMNVGVTAGIETTICDPTWIDGINRMNVTYVSSKHAKDVFYASKFREQNPQGQVVREITLQKPIEILFEGADLSKYFKTTEKLNYDVCKDLDTIPENFCYLFVGHWLQGEFGEDRKNVGYTIKAFLEVFRA